MMRAALLLAGVFLCATPALAALKLCNRTSYILYTATASLGEKNVRTQGWTRIVPGMCQIPIKGDLTASQYFVYARSSLAYAGPTRAWGGATALCVKDDNFSLRTPVGAPNCPGDDSFTRPFAALDTHHMRSWTLNFDDTPPEPSMVAARQDGLKRLFHDNGRAGGDKRAAALRKRLHLDAHADAAQLFDALETSALKDAAPAGFTVCNDGTALMLVALGSKTTTGWRARGWWRIAPGSCAKTLSALPVGGRLYLLAQTKKGDTLAGGTTKFCITDIAFDIEGREHCTARGLKEAGFTPLTMRNAHDHMVHIGVKGLLP
jgi:uncharacterized membrane protein